MTGGAALDDRVELKALLGRGGVGEVHRAWDRVLERAVAVKFLRGFDPREAERILLEARLQARVEHPHVVRVHEVGTLGGRACLVLQLVEGRTLAEVGAECALAERVELLRQAAEGLHAAHREGLVHRDVKPANVLVELGGGVPRALVSDFGLARGDEGGLTRSGVPAGTVEYMSPEQLLGTAPADFRSDVYALGASLYALLAGRAPFRRSAGPRGDAEETSLLRRIVEEAPDPLGRDVPVELRRVVAKAMEKDPAARYASAQAFADDLARFQRGEPVQARAAPLTERALRWTRRNRVASRAIAVAVASLLTALGSALWLSRRAGFEALEAARLGALAASFEARLVAERLAPPHDLRPALAALRPEVERLRSLSERGRASGPASYALGKGLQLLDDLAGARSAYERALADGYDAPEVSEGLGEVLSRIYERERDRAVRTLGPGARGERLAALERELRDPALRHLARGASGGWRHLWLQARVALLEGRFDAARARAEEALLAEPQRYEARVLQGEAWVAEASRRSGAEQLDEALDALRQGEDALAAAAEWGRSDPRLLLLLARLHTARAEIVVREGKDATALVVTAQSWLDRAAQLDPDARALLVTQATLLMDSERLAANYLREAGLPRLRRAVDLMRRATALTPEDVGARTLLMRAHLRLGLYLLDTGLPSQQSFDDGIAVHAATVPLASSDPEVREIGAALLLEKGRGLVQAGRDGGGALRAAVREAEAALQLDPPSPSRLRQTLSEALMFSGHADWLAGVDPRPALARSAVEAEATYRLTGGSFLGGYRAAYVLALASWTLIEMGASADARSLLSRALEVVDEVRRAHPQQPLLPLLHAQVLFLEARRRLGAGEDPMPAVLASRELLAEAVRRVGNPAVASESIAILALTEGSWRLAQGQDPSEVLAEAERRFRRFEAEAPDKFEGPFGLGTCALEQARWLALRGRTAAAAEAARRGLAPAEEAIRRGGRDPHPLVLKARLLGLAGDVAAGRDTLARVLAENPLVAGSPEARAAQAELAER